jgi:hypothetical protein
MLTDIAILTGGQVISEEVGLKLDGVGLELLGQAAPVRGHQGRDDHHRGCRELGPDRRPGHQIRTEIENSDSDYDREKLQERLAKLAGGVAVIKVGAATEVELKERKHRIEDAVRNAKAPSRRASSPVVASLSRRPPRRLSPGRPERRRGRRRRHRPAGRRGPADARSRSTPATRAASWSRRSRACPSGTA